MTEKKNNSHVNIRKVFNLERDGSIVGGVCCHNACGVGHLITGNVELAHLSQAGWIMGESVLHINIKMCTPKAVHIQ